MEKIEINVCITDNEDNSFRFYKAMEFARVPVAGDKLFIAEVNNGSATTRVYNVVDVHFSNEGGIDAYAIYIGNQYDYLNNLAAMHVLK
jgi:hypothetical protein